MPLVLGQQTSKGLTASWCTAPPSDRSATQEHRDVLSVPRSLRRVGRYTRSIGSARSRRSIA